MHHPITSYSYGNAILHQCSAFQLAIRHPNMKRSTKKISFNENVLVHPIREVSSEMSPEEKLQVYYSKDEMRRFQREGNEICKNAAKQARSLSKSDPAVSPAKNLSLIFESDVNLRGFEALVCPTRKSNRSMVIKAVLAYHKKLNSLESSLSPQKREVVLAEAYSKLSYWSQMLAYATARNDRTQAYEQDVVEDSARFVTKSPVPSTSTVWSKSISNVVSPVDGNRRRITFEEDELQRKRCRHF